MSRWVLARHCLGTWWESMILAILTIVIGSLVAFCNFHRLIIDGIQFEHSVCQSLDSTAWPRTANQTDIGGDLPLFVCRISICSLVCGPLTWSGRRPVVAKIPFWPDDRHFQHFAVVYWWELGRSSLRHKWRRWLRIEGATLILIVEWNLEVDWQA